MNAKGQAVDRLRSCKVRNDESARSIQVNALSTTFGFAQHLTAHQVTEYHDQQLLKMHLDIETFMRVRDLGGLQTFVTWAAATVSVHLYCVEFAANPPTANPPLSLLSSLLAPPSFHHRQHPSLYHPASPRCSYASPASATAFAYSAVPIFEHKEVDHRFASDRPIQATDQALSATLLVVLHSAAQV